MGYKQANQAPVPFVMVCMSEIKESQKVCSTNAQCQKSLQNDQRAGSKTKFQRNTRGMHFDISLQAKSKN